jgi:hypothetical protein
MKNRGNRYGEGCGARLRSSAVVFVEARVDLVRYMTMRYKFCVFLFVVLCIGFSHPAQTLAQEAKDASSEKASGKLALAQAVMCEGIRRIGLRI